MKFTTDQTVRRLRWVMGGVLLFDTVNNLRRLSLGSTLPARRGGRLAC